MVTITITIKLLMIMINNNSSNNHICIYIYIYINLSLSLYIYISIHTGRYWRRHPNAGSFVDRKPAGASPLARPWLHTKAIFCIPHSVHYISYYIYIWYLYIYLSIDLSISLSIYIYIIILYIPYIFPTCSLYIPCSPYDILIIRCNGYMFGLPPCAHCR